MARYAANLLWMMTARSRSSRSAQCRIRFDSRKEKYARVPSHLVRSRPKGCASATTALDSARREPSWKSELTRGSIEFSSRGHLGRSPISPARCQPDVACSRRAEFERSHNAPAISSWANYDDRPLQGDPRQDRRKRSMPLSSSS